MIDLDELRPELPGFPTPRGFTGNTWLRYLAERACTARYGDRDDPSAVEACSELDHELKIIAELGMAGYFLIVHDICQYACGISDFVAESHGRWPLVGRLATNLRLAGQPVHSSE
ncbi:hypothetical protein [Streptomyces phaeochromogenes]|uniref:hypothetical protein n=1 Tax=Streptomyces phaeochromogenes TaxID=1923 RepID=UPI0036CCF183